LLLPVKKRKTGKEGPVDTNTFNKERIGACHREFKQGLTFEDSFNINREREKVQNAGYHLCHKKKKKSIEGEGGGGCRRKNSGVTRTII